MKKLVQYKHDPKSYFASIKEYRNNQYNKFKKKNSKKYRNG